MSDRHILIFLIQVFLILSLARGLGEIFRRWRQPALTAEIIVGIFLGPTILGRFFPQLYQLIFPADIIQQNMLETVAWLGIFFLLLEMGLEMDFSTAWRHRGNALKIAIADIIIPALIPILLFYYLLPDAYLVNADKRMVFVIFMGTVLTISALPIAARALKDLDIYKTDLGLLIMSALSVNDVIGWLMFTLVLGLFIQPDINIFKVLSIFIATIGFAIICLKPGRKFADSIIRKIKDKSMPEPGSSLTFICMLGFICGAITQKIGIHALFGFFLAGIMAGGSHALPEKTRHVISQMVYAIFVPFFFVNTGLRIDFLKNFDIFLVLLITIIGIAGRFIGAWIGVNISTVSRVNRLTIAIAHTPGGSMEIIVGLIALEYSLISAPMFEAIVFGAVFSSVILGPWLRYAISRRKEMEVLEFFSRHTLIEDVKATDKRGAISELCSAIAEHNNVPRAEALVAAVMQRENNMGTAVEEGVAVPHARLNSLLKPIVAFGRSRSGIDWDSPDGEPTRLIFLILTSKEEDWSQVQILRIIAKLMASQKNRDALFNAKDAHELWSHIEKMLTMHKVVRKQ